MMPGPFELIIILLLCLWFYFVIGIVLHKAGYSRWWCLVMLIPFVNFIMIWVFAFAKWPNLKK